MNNILKGKALLYVGLILLSMGLFFRYLTDFQTMASFFIAAGIVGKLVYLGSKFKARNYKPGIELIFLSVGLVIFLTGIYMRSQGLTNLGIFLVIAGLLLKVVFIIMFLRKVS